MLTASCKVAEAVKAGGRPCSDFGCHMKPGFSHALVSVTVASWGNDISFLEDNMHSVYIYTDFSGCQ